MKRLVLTLGLIVAGFLAFLLADRSSQIEAPLAPRATQELEAQRKPTGAELVTSQSAQTADSDEARAEAAARPSAMGSDAAENGMLVRVVDPSGTPLAGVPVGIAFDHPTLRFAHIREQEDTSESGEARLDSNISLDKLPDEASVAIQIALPLEPPVAVALGETEPDGSYRLVLPDAGKIWLTPLVVRVLTASGAPAQQVDVELRSRNPNDPGSSDNSLERLTTDRAGQVTFDRLEIARQLTQSRTFGVTCEFNVRIAGPYAQRIEQRLNDAAEKGPILLRLPATGTVEITLRTQSGDRIDRAASASLLWRPINAPGDARFERTRNAWRPIEDGVARFENVGLDLLLEAWAGPDDGAAARGSVRGPGPTATQPVARLEVVVGDAFPSLTGRLVDEAGAPVGEVRFALATPAIEVDWETATHSRLRKSYSYHGTDSAGRFELTFTPGRLERGPLYALFEESAPRAGFQRGQIPRYARTEMPLSVNPGERVDLGDLTFGPYPLLVAGTVVDESGRPLQQAKVRLSYPLMNGRRQSWYNVNVPYAYSAEDGSFSVHSPDPFPELCVMASDKQGRYGEVKGVAPGATNVRLVMRAKEAKGPPGAQVIGNVLLDDGIDSMHVEAVYRHSNGARHDSYVINGVFSFRDVSTGQIRVEIRTRKTDWLLHQVEGVEVQSGQDVREPMLSDIDLRGKLRYLRLLLLDEQGRPVGDTYAWINADSAGGSVKLDDAGHFVALTRASDDRFTIRVNGYAPEEVLYAAHEQTLRLRKAD